MGSKLVMKVIPLYKPSSPTAAAYLMSATSEMWDRWRDVYLPCRLHLPSTELCTSSTLDSRSRRCTIHESESNLSLCLQSVALLRISGQVVRAERGLGNVSVCTQKVLSRRICRSRLTPKFFVQTWDLWFFSSRSLGSTILCILISWYAIIWPSSPKFSCGDQFRNHFTRTISFHLLLN